MVVKEVEVAVEKPIYVDVIKEVEKPVTVERDVIREVEKIVEVPVEIIKT